MNELFFKSTKISFYEEFPIHSHFLVTMKCFFKNHIDNIHRTSSIHCLLSRYCFFTFTAHLLFTKILFHSYYSLSTQKSLWRFVRHQQKTSPCSYCQTIQKLHSMSTFCWSCRPGDESFRFVCTRVFALDCLPNTPCCDGQLAMARGKEPVYKLWQHCLWSGVWFALVWRATQTFLQHSRLDIASPSTCTLFPGSILEGCARVFSGFCPVTVLLSSF